MRLPNTVAVVYGAGGAVGGAVARAFAREGARLFLSGRSPARVEAVAREIRAAGGVAEAAVVDALDERAVDRYLDRLFERTGAIDISFSAVGIANMALQGAPLVELPLESFLRPVETYVTAHFVTARLAARRMIPRRSGVILTISSIPARVGTPLVGGMATAWGGVEALTRTLSAELGPRGIRVLCIRTHGMPETETIHEVFGIHARAHGITAAQFHDRVATQSHLGRLPKLTELGDVAAFVASERAAALTGTVVNLTAGGVAD